MTAYAALSITGPSLTTLGTALLAYDVLRGPVRLIRRQAHDEALRAAGRQRDTAGRTTQPGVSPFTSDEQQSRSDAADATHAAAVGSAGARYERAARRELRRAYRLAIVGLSLVALGGACQTAAAVLAAVTR